MTSLINGDAVTLEGSTDEYTYSAALPTIGGGILYLLFTDTGEAHFTQNIEDYTIVSRGGEPVDDGTRTAITGISPQDAPMTQGQAAELLSFMREARAGNIIPGTVDETPAVEAPSTSEAATPPETGSTPQFVQPPPTSVQNG